jgi:hypothetical protein
MNKHSGAPIVNRESNSCDVHESLRRLSGHERTDRSHGKGTSGRT